MALTLSAKGPNDVVRYLWTPPLADGDSLATYELTETGCVIESDERSEDGVAFYVSGGTAGATATITASAVTDDGEELEETLYLPIQASANALGYTVRDVCGFALRKIVGNGNDPDASELADAVERLNDMLAEWGAMGAQTGVPLPLAAGDTLYCSDAFVSAIKHNLRIACHDHYGQPIDATDARAAMRGMQVVKAANLPAEREGADFY